MKRNFSSYFSFQDKLHSFCEISSSGACFSVFICWFVIGAKPEPVHFVYRTFSFVRNAGQSSFNK